MTMISCNLLMHKSPVSLAQAQSVRRGPKIARRCLVVQAKDNSGIHDPAGPNASWGQGTKKGQQEQAAQENKFELNREHMAKRDARSDQLHHAGQHAVGTSGSMPNKEAAVRHDLNEIRAETAEEAEEVAKYSASDDEWEHMSKVERAKMLFKDKLYAWLGTGAEPL